MHLEIGDVYQPVGTRKGILFHKVMYFVVKLTKGGFGKVNFD